MLRLAAAASLVAMMATISGCSFLKSLVGRNTLDLEGADIQQMEVGLQGGKETVCPRQPVQMSVVLVAKLKEQKQAQRYETWTDGQSHNDKLDFEEFTFDSDFGKFDGKGYFVPDRDLRKSIDKELELFTALKTNPAKFTRTSKYKPSYDCITGAGGDGASGAMGASGASGAMGSSGSTGSSTKPGADGAPGGNGGNGGPGGAGKPGPSIRAYVTKVSTPFYKELVAIKIEGDVQDFILFPPGQHVVLSARGGAGGPGGGGGAGGSGGSGGSGSLGGNGGNGGDGGNGGSGGNGGRGGTIDLVVDSQFPDLGELVRLDVAGGSGGRAGPAGGKGHGGPSGSGMGTGGQSGTRGSDGAAGQPGGEGAAGPPGKSSVKPGPAAKQLADIAGLVLLKK